MVKEGRLRPEDAERHPQRSVITRALGIDANMKVDYDTLDLSEGDRLLLCSDGLSSMLEGSMIERVLVETGDPDSAAERLVSLANDAGGEDNITVVLVDVMDAETRAAPPATSTPEAVVREPVRTETAERPDPPPARSIVARSPRRWLRRLVIWLVALVVLGAGGYFLANFFLDRSWFVGVNEDGFIAVYQGIPEEVLGLDLKDEVRTTSIAVEDLPEFLREDVEDSIKVDNEEDATSKVADLRTRAREAERSGNQGSQQNGQNNDGGGG
jgi:protein phosphatase